MPNSSINRRPLRNRQHRNVLEIPPAAGPALAIDRPEELDSILRERLDLHAELFDAAQIQRKLSGPRLLRCGDLQFASEVFAARHLPGDFAVLSREDSTVRATLGDIAGKGFAAGMWFTNLAGLLQSHSRSAGGPRSTAATINKHLCALRPLAPFVTSFLTEVNCESGTVTYCNAGHFPAILVRGGEETELLTVGGPLLGAIEDARFDAGEVKLGAGDALVVYSDGVLECRNPGGEEFGLDRLREACRKSRQPTAHATLMGVLAAVQDFAHASPSCDDMSIMVVLRDEVL